LCSATSELDVARARRALFDGWIPKATFAAAVNRSTRTIDDWIKDGLPVIYVGDDTHIPLDRGREWLAARRRASRNMPRRGLDNLLSQDATDSPLSAA
jgi:hypothetical protein